MGIEPSQSDSGPAGVCFVCPLISVLRSVSNRLSLLYGLLAPRAYSVIIFGALFCTLAAKFFHSYRLNLVGEYFSWVLTDIAVLLGIEVLLALVCFRWPRKSVVRAAVVTAAVVCTWSVMNAGWLIKTGTQILPTVLLPSN